MKYVQTESGITLFSNDKFFLVQKNDQKYDIIQKMIKNKCDDSEIDQYLNPFKFESKSISINNREIYYNGKYYELNEALYEMFLNVIDKRDSDFSIEIIALFLTKCFKNKLMDFDTLQKELATLLGNQMISILSNGDFMFAKFNEKEKDGVNYDKIREIISEKVKYSQSFARTSPEFFMPNGKVSEYEIDSSLSNPEFLSLSDQIEYILGFIYFDGTNVADRILNFSSYIRMDSKSDCEDPESNKKLFENHFFSIPETNTDLISMILKGKPNYQSIWNYVSRSKFNEEQDAF